MNQKILIVEDEADLAELIAMSLSLHGYETTIANDGRSGLEKIRSEKPMLVLLDVMMPGINGLEVCKKIKSDPETKNIPVVIVSARAHPADRTSGLSAGADDYITKPFSHTQLLDAISRLLNKDH